MRWDAHARTGAVVVDDLAVEVAFDADAVSAPGGRSVEPGELVEVEYAQSAAAGATWTATRVIPTDG